MKTEIWVDGSFKDGKSSWAYIVKQDDKEVFTQSGQITDPKLERFSQIVGELTAAKEAFTWCVNNNVQDVSVYYDYEGIKAWALGNWKAKNVVTQDYTSFTRDILKQLNVTFVKVRAHSGDINNNEVDQLAKIRSAVSIKEITDGIVLTYNLKSYTINFKEMSIKEND